MTRKRGQSSAEKPFSDPDNPPTQPRPHDEFGFELDEFGLPTSGPERARRLAGMARRDPNDFPEDWPDAPGAGDVAPQVRAPADNVINPEADNG